MTSVSLNPPSPSFPLTDQIEDQNQLFISPNNLDSTNSLSSCRNFFNILDQTQMTRETGELRQDQEDDGLVLHGGSSNHHVFNSSFNSPQSQPFRDDRRNECGYKVEEEESKSGYESAKWMSSKMRLMRKMMIPNTTPVPHKVSPTFRTLEHQKTQRSLANHRNGTTTRVCANCNTTSTPLWRGGPMGPKSLCNACGIRQRKARRAMAEAANGVVNSKVNKEKKPRTNHFVQFKNKCRATSSAGTSQAERRNTGFKDFAFSFRNNISVVEQVFPPDEVAEAALLLMDLSCASIRI